MAYTYFLVLVVVTKKKKPCLLYWKKAKHWPKPIAEDATFFYPLYKVCRARAFDFDQDGDQNILIGAMDARYYYGVQGLVFPDEANTTAVLFLENKLSK